MPPRAHVSTGRPHRGRPLEEQLPHEQDERPRDVEAVRQERPVARVRSLLCLHAADREDHPVGLAREEVAATRASVGEQPRASRVASLDLGAVRGRRAGHQRPGLLLHPPEGRDVLVGSKQDPGLARARLRGEIGLPLREAVVVLRYPPRHRRCAAVAHRMAEHRQGEPVDLQKQDPGNVGPARAPLAAGDAFDHAE